jgi:PAS domain S-box-containing protein
MLEKYSQLTPGAFFILERDKVGDYRLPSASESIYRITGYSAKTLKRKPHLFFVNVHPDDILQLQQQIQLSGRELQQLYVKCRFLHAAGHWVWLSIKAAPQYLNSRVRWCGFTYVVNPQA